MIDLRIVNDFPDDKKTAILENLAGCVRQIDCTLDPVAKTKLFCQTHCSIADGDDPARPAHFFHNVAAVVRLHLLLHGSHHVRCAEVHFLPRCCAAGNQVRAHTIVVILSAAKDLESSTRCTFDARVASSGCVVAMSTGVPTLTSAKNFGAASPCSRMQPCVRGVGCTKPW